MICVALVDHPQRVLAFTSIGQVTVSGQAFIDEPDVERFEQVLEIIDRGRCGSRYSR